jgi:hypothetical protein
MVASADSIDDLDVLRHGGMSRLFTGMRALRGWARLRSFTFGQVAQLDAVNARFLAGLTGKALTPLVDAEQLAYLDIDDTIRQVHSYRKQGAAYAEGAAPERQ